MSWISSSPRTPFPAFDQRPRDNSTDSCLQDSLPINPEGAWQGEGTHKKLPLGTFNDGAFCGPCLVLQSNPRRHPLRPMARERQSPGQLAGHRSPPQRSVNVGRLAPVPSPISAPSIMAAGISVTGAHQGMFAPYASRRGALEPHPLADKVALDLLPQRAILFLFSSAGTFALRIRLDLPPPPL